MLANYGTSSSSLCEAASPPARHSRAPLVTCTRATHRHLVMPSLRSLVTSSSSSSSNPTAVPGTVSRAQQRPLGSSPKAESSMGAASSSAQLEKEGPTEEACSRLIAPRPLMPALSPKQRPMKRDSSCGSLLMGLRPSLPAGRNSTTTAIRKCETVLALSSLEPLKPVNRLRVASSKGLVCSRCSSLLSMASASRASLNTVMEGGTEQPQLLCKLCLCEVPLSATTCLQQCQCRFCTECLRQYVSMEVAEAAYQISCPDAQCEGQGVMALSEIEVLVTTDLMEKHRKFRLDREVDLDSGRLWCPRAGCETVCRVCPGCLPQSVHCPTCEDTFCSNCKQPWHAGKTCAEDRGASKLIFDPERIKLCPMCGVPIEKDEGCAQMMCKRCKHVFCWYCLASLDDDFLLRHYDKGPCKNKLGHSRASVIWHRTQVIAIFAGFGVLLLVASPLLLLAAPCIVCCKCRACQDKLEEEDTSNTNLEPTQSS